MLGPMAVDGLACGEPGLLLAGDAAGFIDPMTGDGLRLALAGAELAAAVTLDVLAGRVAPDHAHTVLAARRRRRVSIEVAVQSHPAIARLLAARRHRRGARGPRVAVGLRAHDSLRR